MNKHLHVCAAAALLGVMSLTFAADAPERCSSLFDDAQRLACYDAQFGKPVRTAPAPIPTPKPMSAQPLNTPAPSMAAKADSPAAPKSSEEIVTARITAVSRATNDRFVVTLDNGQRWSQLERDLSAEVHVGDAVKIRPAMLGSWMLETRGGVRTRVRAAR